MSGDGINIVPLPCAAATRNAVEGRALPLASGMLFGLDRPLSRLHAALRGCTALALSLSIPAWLAMTAFAASTTTAPAAAPVSTAA